MQAAIIITVKHSGTVRKIQLYMYIEKRFAEFIKITFTLNRKPRQEGASAHRKSSRAFKTCRKLTRRRFKLFMRYLSL